MSIFCIINANLVHPRCKRGRGGDTSLRTFSKKRYRYCGKEKDAESGLYYYGARYYAAWTCRFISVDPLVADYPFYTPYNYAGNKPINKIDIDGMQEEGAATAPTEAGSSASNNDLPDHIGLGLKIPFDQLPQEKFTSRADSAIEVTSPRGDKVILGGVDNIAVRGDNTTWGFTTISGENYRWHNDVGEYLLNTSNTVAGQNSFPLITGEMTYAGEHNPKSADSLLKDDFSLPPTNIADFYAMIHDINYSYIPGAEGKEGTQMIETIPADIELIKGMDRVIEMYHAGEIDPWTGYSVSKNTYKNAVKMKAYFTGMVNKRITPVYKNSMFVIVTIHLYLNPKNE